MNIPLSSPSITDLERSAVLSVLDTTSLSMGPMVPKFEADFAAIAGTKYAVAVNSGTSGLHLCIKAAGIEEGDEVITTPFSFVATASCVLYERGIPVFVDIDPVSLNLDTRELERAASARTKAIIPVHVFGRPCAMDRVLSFARARNLFVIEDACEALGATFQGKHTGSMGDAGVFGFYPNKQMTTGEGGIITTDNPRTAERCRAWRNHGRGNEGEIDDSVGYNYRLSDINCALGIAQLTRLPQILAERAAVARTYQDLLTKLVPEVVLPAAPEPGVEMSWFVYVVQLPDELNRSHRDEILNELRASGVGCSDYFQPIHLRPFYRKRFGFARGDFPRAEYVSDRTIALPMFGSLDAPSIRFICDTLRGAIDSVRPAAVYAAGQTA